jgi:hypothetical protein
MEIIAFPWGAAYRAKSLAVLRVRLTVRRTPIYYWSILF